jgi:hypothetical protein
MNKEIKDFLTLGGCVAGVVGATVIVTMGTIGIIGYIGDTIKYNRYQEAVKEYRQCAQKYQDEHSVRVYCGDPPSSTIMI